MNQYKYLKETPLSIGDSDGPTSPVHKHEISSHDRLKDLLSSVIGGRNKRSVLPTGMISKV